MNQIEKHKQAEGLHYQALLRKRVEIAKKVYPPQQKDKKRFSHLTDGTFSCGIANEKKIDPLTGQIIPKYNSTLFLRNFQPK